MIIVVKPFSRGSAAIRLAYGKVENGKFIPTNDVRKDAKFAEYGKREVSGDLNLEGKQSAFAVQKWEGISSPSPTKVWEVIYGA